MKRYALLILLAPMLWQLAPTASAQTDVQLTQFYELPTLYNPAAIGQTDFLRIRGGGRLQWVGIDNAPKSFMLSADMPVKFLGKRFGAGVNALTESYGLYKTLAIDAQFGFKLRKWGGEFTAALNLGMYDQSFKGSDIYIPEGDDYHQDVDDALPQSDLHGTAFDLGLGLWYAHKYWQAGLSATHLMSPKITMGSEDGGGSESTAGTVYEFEARRTLYFMAMGNIPLKNTLFELMPALLVKSDFTFTTAELMARARYNKFLSFGIGYRWDDAITATIAAEIKNFYIGYSFDYATSALHSASSGSHEIVAGYRLKLNMGEKNRNRHKSVRVM